ncbi:hypothetical protein [Microbispora sp. H10836]|uniref:hypothetical protein n=1 Tax=Microbispora sp. H10836 TaxID=2729106 RepID=UPI001474F858|nr:hypothetical protein [Microbispora sp. H10836]
MTEFFKTVGMGASIVPVAVAVVVVAAGLTAIWAPSAKRQTRAVQVLKIVLRIPPRTRRSQVEAAPRAADLGELPPFPGREK